MKSKRCQDQLTAARRPAEEQHQLGLTSFSTPRFLNSIFIDGCLHVSNELLLLVSGCFGISKSRNLDFFLISRFPKLIFVRFQDSRLRIFKNSEIKSSRIWNHKQEFSNYKSTSNNSCAIQVRIDICRCKTTLELAQMMI